MQIDMHYYGVYALARLAGIRADAAQIVATASQYVDDAINDIIQHHENGNRLAPILTAHRIIEIVENRDEDDQPFVWVPFHFFPGNDGNGFSERLICRKDGALINEAINHYLALKDCPFALELLGIITHVYADTFAHFGFSGVSSRKNKVKAKSIKPINATAPTADYLSHKIDGFFRKFGFQGGLFTNFRRSIMSDGAEIASGALGHGAVATFPDIPYLEWEFEYDHPHSFIESQQRNNTNNFLEACEKIYSIFKRFLGANPTYCDNGGDIDFADVKTKINGIISIQKGKTDRSEKWRNAFKSGELGIKQGEHIPVYSEKTWNKQRENFSGLDQPVNVKKQEVYRFYQAASFHLHYTLRELLPKHDLVVV